MGSDRLRLLSYLTPGFPVSLFERIATTLDAELLLDQTRSGPAPGHDPFAAGEADLGWLCSTSFVDLATRGDTTSVAVVGVAWVPADPASGGEAVYFGDVVVRSESPVRSFEDLAGRAIGCNDEVSLSGNYSFRIAAHDRGIEPEDFADLRFTGGHHRSLDLLVAGELDAAVIDSVVRIGRASRDDAVAALRVVERLGPWPVQPLVASTRLDPATVQRIRVALLESNDDPIMRNELTSAALAGFTTVDDDHYLPVRTAFPGFL